MKRKAQKYSNKIKHAGICLNRPKASNTGIAGYAKIGLKNGSDIANGGGYYTKRTSSHKCYVKRPKSAIYLMFLWHAILNLLPICLRMEKN